ncbi:hypothetical protein PQO03_17960 [Lentisphaera profundi]|jgi:hypothetical protein|uniref:Uncharacterized protein n=1 Tax=Lentisphaera profundi TaxID=1658616 RepID=A0ABY7VVC4_9BACT|nr:hypothetical protein [Lentisphaera profundi]WDE97714.1 hypothetical protein PQO03_17960 [Lentisphaera profundi]
MLKIIIVLYAKRTGNLFLYKQREPELYNFRNDVGEKCKLAELMADFSTWKKKIGAQLPLFNANYSFEKEQDWIFSKSSTQK